MITMTIEDRLANFFEMLGTGREERPISPVETVETIVIQNKTSYNYNYNNNNYILGNARD
jgi:hypothetical protein